MPIWGDPCIRIWWTIFHKRNGLLAWKVSKLCIGFSIQHIAKHSRNGEIRRDLDFSKIPLRHPSVYKPFILGLSVLALQYVGGDNYLSKFTIQILASENVVSPVNKTLINTVSPDKDSINNISNKFLLPLLIQIAKLLMIFLLSIFMGKSRIRSLYFSSLALTSASLLLLGITSNSYISSIIFPLNYINYIKTGLYCLHIFSTHFGLQTLPGFFMDILYPTSCKAVLKGFSVCISQIFLFALINTLKQFTYSTSFFIMAAILFVAVPIMYLFLPEVRNIGTSTVEDFFLPFQSVFYFPEDVCVHTKKSLNPNANIATGISMVTFERDFKRCILIQLWVI